MRKAVVFAFTAMLLAAIPSAVSAEEIALGGGNDFGQHVASMAPEHAIAHGVEFGQGVSTMARTGACPQ